MSKDKERKCQYCNGTGEIEVLQNYADFHYEGCEPVYGKEPCEECNPEIL